MATTIAKLVLHLEKQEGKAGNKTINLKKFGDHCETKCIDGRLYWVCENDYGDPIFIPTNQPC